MSDYDDKRSDVLCECLATLGEHFSNVVILAADDDSQDVRMWERQHGSVFAGMEMCRFRLARWEAFATHSTCEIDDDEDE